MFLQSRRQFQISPHLVGRRAAICRSKVLLSSAPTLCDSASSSTFACRCCCRCCWRRTLPVRTIFRAALFVCVLAAAVVPVLRLLSANTMAPAIPILSSILPSSSNAHSYLLPMPSEPALEADVKAELDKIEQEFSLDKALLDKQLKQMLWEYQTGLAQHSDESNRDTFLPMMCVQSWGSSQWAISASAN